MIEQTQASFIESCLFAESPAQRVVYQFARAETLSGWWVWAAILLGIALAVFACVFFYRRDAAELSRPVRWTLIGLRLTVVFALVFIFFDLVRRTEQRITRQSEVVVLVDTSQSMSLPAGSELGQESRTQRARDLLEDSGLVSRLREEHRTSVYAFGESSEPQLILTSISEANANEEVSVVPAGIESGDELSWQRGVRSLGWVSMAVFVIASVLALIVGVLNTIWRRSGARLASHWLLDWSLVTAALTMVVGIVCFGSLSCLHSDWSLGQVAGWQTGLGIGPVDSGKEDDSSSNVSGQNAGEDVETNEVDWEAVIAAGAAQSRIGDSLKSVLVDHDLTTLAGVVLVTDGQNNGGASLSTAVAMARRNEVSLYPVGLGSSRPPTNVRVVDLESPRRVYPGDKFVVSAVLQATGEKPIEVDVELVDSADSDRDGAANEIASSMSGGQVLETQKVKLFPDATLTGIRFEVEPQTVGRRKLAVRVIAPAADRNAEDDIQMARYEVVARRLRVLAIAGGPTREYRFVRNLLHRDESVELDVWLQTGRTGMSQDANTVLDAFPDTADALFDYDAIMMFDPDWSSIDSASLDLMDRFLTQQAGGLVLVAGPVYHPKITGSRNDPRLNQIRSFFPVNLSGRGPLLSGGRQGGVNAWPLEFTPEAAPAEFLWVAATAPESFAVWEASGSVYDFVGVKSAKPGAKVYAYFSDPTSEVSGSLPIFLASQFYGAGRVFFQGSGEMWRLRSAGDQYFDNYYTKLVRWVSEGRLLRDSNRGILLADMTRAMVGQTISLRAVLVDDQFQPLTEPFVTIKLLSPDGSIKDLRMQPAADSPQGGTYTGSFVATASGNYEVRLTVGDALDEQVLRRSIQVRLPTSELERPRRADDELSLLASTTRGSYLPIESSTSMNEVVDQLDEMIVPQPQMTVIAGTPDRPFNERRNAALMWLIASVLTFEWLVRRLHKLA